MRRVYNTGLIWGVTLIVLGLLVLAFQLFGLPDWWDPAHAWPLIVVGVGAVLLFVGILTRARGLAIPACIVGGIGLMLYYQNATGDWESWAYAWTLIPGFVGAGIVLASLAGDRPHRAVGAGGQLILISLILFAIFGAFLGPLRGWGLARFWPVLLILLGVIAMLRPLGSRRTQGSPDDPGSGTDKTK